MTTKAHVTVTSHDGETLFSHIYTLETPFNKDGSFSKAKEGRNLEKMSGIKETLRRVYPSGHRDRMNKLVVNYETK